jgi:hypothetical protein
MKPLLRPKQGQSNWVHENDGDQEVTNENLRSEVYLDVKYRGDYYSDFDQLSKNKHKETGVRTHICVSA